jgi:hypothetical protein
MDITTEQLLAMPSGIVFYEIDLPSTLLLQKIGNSLDKRDVIAFGFSDEDEDHLRLGLAEMDEVERNTKRWHVCEPKELERMIQRLSEGAFATQAVINSAVIEEWKKDPKVQGAVGKKSRWT